MRFSKIVLFLSAFISILLLLYTSYRVLNLGITPLRVLIFLFSLLSISFLYLLSKLSEELKTNISLSIVMFVIGLYIFNFFSSSFIFSEIDVNKKRIEIAKENDIQFDERSRIEVIEDFNKSGIETYPAFGPKEFINSNGLKSGNGRIWPLGNISNKNIVLGNENGYWSVYKSDNLGFHNDVFLSKGENITTLLIGDSAVEGSAVKTENNFSGTLKDLGLNSVNLGRVGNGPNLNYAILQEYINYFKPRYVLWFHVENDLNNIHVRKNDFENTIIMKYLNDDNYTQNLIERQIEVDYILTEYLTKKINENKRKPKKNIVKDLRDFIFLSNLKEFIAYLLYSANIQSSSEYLESIKEYRELLSKAKNLVEKNNAKMYFIYLPQWRSYGEENSYYWPLEYKEELLKNVDSLNIKIIDIQKEIDNTILDPLTLWPFRTNGHMNERGYRFVGETVHKNLDIQ